MRIFSPTVENSWMRRFAGRRDLTFSHAVGGGTRPSWEWVVGSDGGTGAVQLAITAASLGGMALAGLFYDAALPVMLGAAALTAVVVAPVAVRVGFRYGAKRGVEAAIETMGPADYLRNAESSGEPSSDK